VDGSVFDTNIKSVAEENGIYQSGKSYLPLEVAVVSSEVIQGFSLILKKLRREGTAKALVTSEKAYGSVGSSSIRPFEPLIFEIIVLTEAPESTDDETED